MGFCGLERSLVYIVSSRINNEILTQKERIGGRKEGRRKEGEKEERKERRKERSKEGKK